MNDSVKQQTFTINVPADGIMQPGHLTLAATPIGNMLDASIRLRLALAEAEIIAAEDTRRTIKLAQMLGVELSGKLLSCHEHNETGRVEQVLEFLSQGKKVLVVTDAGMPVVSDPGFRLVQATRAAGLPVEVFPGPSAVLTALASSGIAPDRFSFEGFLPRKASAQKRMLQPLVSEQRSMVFFESPRRTLDTLKTMAEVFSADRQAAVCRELTKTFEEVQTGSLGELVSWAQAKEILGEIAIVIAGADSNTVDAPELEQLLSEVDELVSAGERLKSATKAVAAKYVGVRASELYDAALKQRT